VQLNGRQVAERLWPLNDVFRRRLHEVADLEYDARYTTAADSAIDDMVALGDLEVLGRAPAGVVRVLLERQRQMLVVALANEEAGNPVTTLPSGLSPGQQCVGLVLLLLRGMALPWPPGGPTRSAGN